MKEIGFGITILSFVVNIISIFMSFFGKKRKLLDNFITAYVSWTLLIGVMTYVMALNKINNLPLLHLHTLIEFILVSLFIRNTLYDSKRTTKLWNIFFLIEITFILFNSVFVQSLNEFNSYAKTTANLLLLSGILFYYFERSYSSILTNKERGINILMSGFLLYFSGSLFIFMTSNLLMYDGSNAHNILWTINSFLYLVFQVIILIGIWKMVSPRNKSFH